MSELRVEGLGMSVGGFALMLRRLKAIEDHVESPGERVDQVTRVWRQGGL